MTAPRLFGTNGIRGVVGEEINVRFAYRVGSSVGSIFPRGPVAAGRDGRLSSPVLYEAVIAGVLAQGCDVDDHGLITTPALEFLVKSRQDAGGIIVTASHNPPEYNGFKVVDHDGIEISRNKEERVEQLIQRDQFKLKRVPGRRIAPEGALHSYLSNLRTQLEGTSLRGVRVIVDSGNGVSTLTTPMVLRSLGCDVMTMNDNIDGRFPGRLSEPRPETLSALSALVREEHADLGVAHDGDGDRAIFVDETGNVQWGDRSLALIEDEILKERPGSKIVTPVNSSMALSEIARKRHGRLILTKVGSIQVSRTMIKIGAVLGGEENGGIFYGPHHPVRDGTIAALLVMRAMTKNRLSLSKLLARLPKFPMVKEKFSSRNEVAKNRAMVRLESKLGNRITSRLDGLRIDLKGRGWVLIRPSGTEPLIRFYAEGRTEKDLLEIVNEFKPLVPVALR